MYILQLHKFQIIQMSVFFIIQRRSTSWLKSIIIIQRNNSSRRVTRSRWAQFLSGCLIIIISTTPTTIPSTHTHRSVQKMDCKLLHSVYLSIQSERDATSEFNYFCAFFTQKYTIPKANVTIHKALFAVWIK